MEQRPSWEANSHSASHEIPLLITEPEDSLSYSQQPANSEALCNIS
jgi:hypothetical protein